MHPEPKKLGELLVEAELLTPQQLQEALRYQRITGGRMGSNLVALGFISEDVLMDFLSRQTGVPRMDLRHVEVTLQALERIPKRLAEQMNILPVSLKEPKSLILAMADPSDLNAVDSARFASGLNIEPVVSTYSALKAAIAEHYGRLVAQGARPAEPTTIQIQLPLGEALPVPLVFDSTPVDRGPAHQTGAIPVRDYGKDPFFDDSTVREAESPNTFFGGDAPDPFDFIGQSNPLLQDAPAVIPERVPASQRIPKLEDYQPRTIVLGLVRLLQKRGILAEEELVRTIQGLIDARELSDGGR